eukprot:GAFH01001936.1.p3 GENE.GAFH01001936.1~~GAFH01001936.1.p3  ORF type:complete len:148 (-),score=54.56 GAFH01001936.1:159-602(-)
MPHTPSPAASAPAPETPMTAPGLPTVTLTPAASPAPQAPLVAPFGEPAAPASQQPADELPAESQSPAPEAACFEAGAIPLAITGAKLDNATGAIMHLMSWQTPEGIETVSFVNSALTNVKCPQLVIQFYESRLKFDRKPKRSTRKQE